MIFNYLINVQSCIPVNIIFIAVITLFCWSFYYLNHGAFFLLLLMPNEWRCYSDTGIPIPKTLVIWASPFHITLAIWIRARVTGDAYITGVLGRGCPCYCNSGSDHTLTPTPLLLCLNRFAIFECFWLSHSLITSLCVLITGFLTLISIWYDASSSPGFVPKNVNLRKQLATVIRPLFSPFTASSQAFSVNAIWWRETLPNHVTRNASAARNYEA